MSKKGRNKKKKKKNHKQEKNLWRRVQSIIASMQVRKRINHKSYKKRSKKAWAQEKGRGRMRAGWRVWKQPQNLWCLYCLFLGCGQHSITDLLRWVAVNAVFKSTPSPPCPPATASIPRLIFPFSPHSHSAQCCEPFHDNSLLWSLEGKAEVRRSSWSKVQGKKMRTRNNHSNQVTLVI